MEDILHFFYDCEISKFIWKETEKWINRGSLVQIKFNLRNVIFGFEEKRNDALNCIVILIKQQLFVQKLNNKMPIFNTIKKKVIQYYEDEKYINYISGTHSKFVVKWQSLRSLFV